MFIKLKNLLPGAISRAGIKRQVNAALICSIFDEVIKDIFDERILKSAKALHFKNGILTIAVLNSVWAQEMKFKEREIIKNINKKVGKEVVEGMRFRT